ncbi:mechanosensitive ion channel family protein [candidate division KSB1 bacterium]|nr:mechanosensitive ion channel family protein [candidate division KSB1 bacterium]
MSEFLNDFINPILTWMGKQGYQIALILIIMFIMMRLADLYANRLVKALIPKKRKLDGEYNKRAETLGNVIHYVLTFILIGIAVAMCFNVLKIEIGPILAAAGVLGLAVGFGAQSLVKDLISGFFILLEDQIRVGDVVEIAGKSGVVERMNLKMTILRDLSGNVHFVPNGEISVVTNMTKGYSCYVLEIGVAYREDVDKVMAVMHEVDEDLRADPDFGPDILEPLDMLGLDEFGESALIIKARLTTRPIKQWRTAREFRRRLKKLFDERNIEIPFPHVTLYIGKDKQDQSPPLNIRLEQEDKE